MSRPRRLAGLLLFWAATAGAALPDEVQVYADDLERAGERGVELHVNTTPSGRAAPSYPGEVTNRQGLRVTPELSWGLGHDMDWGLYLPFVRAADGGAFFAGPKFRLKWMPLLPAQGGSGYFAGLNGELGFLQERFEKARRGGEIRPILGYRGARWLVAVNPNLEFDLAGPDSGVIRFSASAAAGTRPIAGPSRRSSASRQPRPFPRSRVMGGALDSPRTKLAFPLSPYSTRRRR